MADNKILSKIRGLLERASHEGTSVEEREACLAKAQELQDKYAIEEWELNRADPGRATRPIVRDVMINRRGTRWSGKMYGLWSVIAHHSNVMYQMAYKQEGTVARTVGFESDIGFAEMLFAMASLEFYAKIEPGWDKSRTFDDNVKRLKDSGQKWVDIAILANRNGGNPRTGEPGSTTNGAWLISAYKRECKRLGVEPTRHTQRHEAFRKSFAESFVSEMSNRLYAMRRSADVAAKEDDRFLPVIADRKEQAQRKFWEIFPDAHPDEVRRRSEASEKAEQERRAAMSPEERDREDRGNARWWEKERARRAREYEESGWAAGTEAARNVDLTGGANAVPKLRQEALGG